MDSTAMLVLAGIIIAASGAAVYFLVLKNKGGSTPTPNPVPVPATGWNFQYSYNVPTQVPRDGDGNYYIDFPSQDGVHYVIERPPQMTMGQTITMRYTVTGNGAITSVQGNTPGWVTLYMQRVGDNLSGAGPYQQYRYFGGFKKLEAGDAIVTLQLAGDKWGDVQGKAGTDYPAEFAACIANAGAVGFVFGDPGIGATGHGGYAKNGSATFTLKEFSIR